MQLAFAFSSFDAHCSFSSPSVFPPSAPLFPPFLFRPLPLPEEEAGWGHTLPTAQRAPRPPTADWGVCVQAGKRDGGGRTNSSRLPAAAGGRRLSAATAAAAASPLPSHSPTHTRTRMDAATRLLANSLRAEEKETHVPVEQRHPRQRRGADREAAAAAAAAGSSAPPRTAPAVALPMQTPTPASSTPATPSTTQLNQLRREVSSLKSRLLTMQREQEREREVRLQQREGRLKGNAPAREERSVAQTHEIVLPMTVEAETATITPARSSLSTPTATPSCPSPSSPRLSCCSICLSSPPSTLTLCCRVLRVCTPCMRRLLQLQSEGHAAAKCPNCNRRQHRGRRFDQQAVVLNILM